jgi:phosphate transport system substrate-binding protein
VKSRLLTLSIIFALSAVCVDAQKLNSLSVSKTDQTLAGTIRVWGNDRMDTLMKYWQEGFRKRFPGVHFENKLIGTGTGMAGLYSSVADLALMGRDATASEVMAFEWVFKYKPLGVEVTNGSLDVPGKTFALAVFVNKDNPIAKLTLAQLDAIFGSEHLRGTRNARTWGDLGLTGDWQSKAINSYGYDAETNTGLFFKRVVFNGSDKWSCDLKEFTDQKKPDGAVADASDQILRALARDPYGIAYANPRYASPQVKAIAIASTDAAPAYETTKANLIDRKYPLARTASIYVNREPGKPIDPKVKEFLLYILSQDGQLEVMREGDFLPLSKETQAEQRRKLE